jgi:hypothetical protein
VCEHLGENKLEHEEDKVRFPRRSMRPVQTHGIELVTQVDRVDVIAFEVGEHDDLYTQGTEVNSTNHPFSERSCLRGKSDGRGFRGRLTKKTMENNRAAAIKTAKRNSQAVEFGTNRGARAGDNHPGYGMCGREVCIIRA